jgi:hypothetical protein
LSAIPLVRTSASTTSRDTLWRSVSLTGCRRPPEPGCHDQDGLPTMIGSSIPLTGSFAARAPTRVLDGIGLGIGRRVAAPGRDRCAILSPVGRRQRASHHVKRNLHRPKEASRLSDQPCESPDSLESR